MQIAKTNKKAEWGGGGKKDKQQMLGVGKQYEMQGVEWFEIKRSSWSLCAWSKNEKAEEKQSCGWFVWKAYQQAFANPQVSLQRNRVEEVGNIREG